MNNVMIMQRILYLIVGLVTGLSMATLVVIAAPPAPDHVYLDVPENQWFSEGIKYVTRNGYMKGYSDSVFGRQDPVTREQLATILKRMDSVNSNSYAYTQSVLADIAAIICLNPSFMTNNVSLSTQQIDWVEPGTIENRYAEALSKLCSHLYFKRGACPIPYVIPSTGEIQKEPCPI